MDMSFLRADLSKISAWARVNRLKLNASKTMAMGFSTNSWAADIPELVFEGVTVHYTECAKNLGLTIDNRMNWEKHANQVSAKVFAGLRNMWPSARFLPLKTRELLVKSLLLPHFIDLSVGTRNILEKAFNACVRFVYGIGRYDSVSGHVHRLLGNGVFVFLEYIVSSFLHKVIISREPEYVYENLGFGSFHRTFNLILPRNDRNIVNNSFYVRGIARYNALPTSVKNKFSITGFKRACKDHLGLSRH